MATRTIAPPTEIRAGDLTLPTERCLQLFHLMVRTRALEERSIKMSKSGEGLFWVGGPGEEAFNVCLGLQINKGRGPSHDFLHLHYRNSGLVLALGMSMLDHVRQGVMSRTDSNSMGRNFISHYAIPAWNIVPVTSAIEVQYSMASGTAMMQKRSGGTGVSIVLGGDAGSAEGDFASCMIWSTRPDSELPVLMVVTNNQFGISTPAATQHGETRICDRGKAFGIPGRSIDGNDPIVAWHAIATALEYCREHRQPYLLEAEVARIFGHSSSSGAQRIPDEQDCVANFERKLILQGALDSQQAASIWRLARDEADEAVVTALAEPQPNPHDVYLHTYAPSKVDCVYPNDYTGLPRFRVDLPLRELP